jgi:hypothetical protein
MRFLKYSKPIKMFIDNIDYEHKELTYYVPCEKIIYKCCAKYCCNTKHNIIIYNIYVNKDTCGQCYGINYYLCCHCFNVCNIIY